MKKYFIKILIINLIPIFICNCKSKKNSDGTIVNSTFNYYDPNSHVPNNPNKRNPEPNDSPMERADNQTILDEFITANAKLKEYLNQAEGVYLKLIETKSLTEAEKYRKEISDISTKAESVQKPIRSSSNASIPTDLLVKETDLFLEFTQKSTDTTMVYAKASDFIFKNRNRLDNQELMPEMKKDLDVAKDLKIQINSLNQKTTISDKENLLKTIDDRNYDLRIRMCKYSKPEIDSAPGYDKLFKDLNNIEKEIKTLIDEANKSIREEKINKQNEKFNKQNEEIINKHNETMEKLKNDSLKNQKKHQEEIIEMEKNQQIIELEKKDLKIDILDLEISIKTTLSTKLIEFNNHTKSIENLVKNNINNLDLDSLKSELNKLESLKNNFLATIQESKEKIETKKPDNIIFKSNENKAYYESMYDYQVKTMLENQLYNINDNISVLNDRLNIYTASFIRENLLSQTDSIYEKIKDSQNLIDLLKGSINSLLLKKNLNGKLDNKLKENVESVIKNSITISINKYYDELGNKSVKSQSQWRALLGKQKEKEKAIEKEKEEALVKLKNDLVNYIAIQNMTKGIIDLDDKNLKTLNDDITLLQNCTNTGEFLAYKQMQKIKSLESELQEDSNPTHKSYLISQIIDLTIKAEDLFPIDHPKCEEFINEIDQIYDEICKKKSKVEMTSNITKEEAAKILNVPINVSKEEIRRGYYKEALKHHPDKGGTAEMLQKINEAYQILTKSLPA